MRPEDMPLQDVLDELGIGDHRQEFEPGWQESGATYPGADLPFLHETAVRENARLAGLDAEAVAFLLKTAERLRRSAPLARLLWHCRWALRNAPDRRPGLEAALGNDALPCNLLLVLSQMPAMRARYEESGIPEDVRLATCSDAVVWRRYYHRSRGVPGLTDRIVGWLQNHVNGRLYRLGRLQFMPGPFHGGLRAFRSRRTGAVLALAEGGIRFGADGQYASLGRDPGREGTWTSQLTADETGVTSSPISPAGHAVRRPVTLPAGEWQQVLAPGDPMLDVHIPAGSPMTPAACRDAVERALEFFPRFFPGHAFKGFMCYSWFLDTQYDGLLPEDSNIVRFQREFYLFPTEENGAASLWRIFGESAEAMPADDLPTDTVMRRAVVRHLKAGGALRSGGAFFLADDLPWGRQVYRGMLEAGELPV